MIFTNTNKSHKHYADTTVQGTWACLALNWWKFLRVN